ncbi:PAS domain S-box protein [Arcicella sp. DC2W]|uniref:histidine kinase n=1 Tax=Arcicella gelida TaxID=2984195 RepID=A0ABU5S9X4_9BACT|nr:PAS domain S-box protein [Arcicella sp. DC2W]MEA5405280.1 PAS domain S-box protein [Arcicella sp. DC2W]
MNNFTPPNEFITIQIEALQENDFDLVLDVASNIFDSSVICLSFLGVKKQWHRSDNDYSLNFDFNLSSYLVQYQFSNSEDIFNIKHPQKAFFVENGITSIISKTLYLSNGAILGHISLLNSSISELSAKEQKILRTLSQKAIALIEQNQLNLEELVFEKNQLKVLLSTTNDYIWCIDKNLNLISANKTYIDTIKKHTGKILKGGNSFLLKDYYTDELIEFFKIQSQKAFLGNAFSVDTYIPATKWYNEQWMEISFQPIYENGEVEKLVINARNITKRKKDKEKINKSKEQYELLFLSNPQPMWIYDIETLAFLEINNAAIQHYGYSREEFLQMTLLDIRPKEDAYKYLDHSNPKDELEANQYEWRHIKKNGETIFVLITTHGIKYHGRRARHVLINDITEQKLYLQLLEKEKTNTAALINSTDDLVWSIDENQCLVTANDAYLNLIEHFGGIRIKQGDCINNIKGFDNEVNLYWKTLNERVLSGETFTHELYSPNIDSNWGYWSEIRFNPIKDGDKIRGAAMFARNISNRKEIELALETNQRILLETSEVARVGGWEIDLVNQTVSWSKITKEIHELPLDYDVKIDEILHFYREGENRERIRKLIDTVVAEAKDFDFETPILTAKGNEKWIRVKGGVATVEGKSVRIHGMVQDLEDIKKFEILLKETSEIGRVGGWQYDIPTQKVTWGSITKEIHEVPIDYEPTFETSMSSYKEGESRDAIIEAVNNAIHSGTPYDLEVQIVTAKGKERWVRAKGRVELAQGKPIRLYGMIQDINDQKKHLGEIEAQNKQLREIAWMQSHVVRAPVARIMGIINLLNDFDSVELSKEELLQNILDSAYELDGIIRKINNTIKTDHNNILI